MNDKNKAKKIYKMTTDSCWFDTQISKLVTLIFLVYFDIESHGVRSSVNLSRSLAAEITCMRNHIFMTVKITSKSNFNLPSSSPFILLESLSWALETALESWSVSFLALNLLCSQDQTLTITGPVSSVWDERAGPITSSSFQFHIQWPHGTHWFHCVMWLCYL